MVARRRLIGYMRFWWFLALGVWAYAQTYEGNFRGIPVNYTIQQGMAVVEGDIILGPVEQVEHDAGKLAPSREATAFKGSQFRWTDRVIPYVIDPALTNQGRVTDAVKHWNDNTPIRLIERTTERNYVRFMRDADGCSANIGMQGGQQFVRLADNCSLGAVIHEIGHAAGLWHEQSRHDRDFYIKVLPENIDKRYYSEYLQRITNGDDIGAYDFSSIMHYSNGGFSRFGMPAMQSIPAGIPLGQRGGLSASDIDAVKRMYGEGVQATTITTFPEGLIVAVDGQQHKTPVSFDWQPGSQHTVGVPSPQLADDFRYLFGRWSDDRPAAHRITAGAETTVYTAAMVRQVRLPSSPSPAGSGVIVLNPPANDGWITDGTVLEFTAQPAPGFSFQRWTGSGFFSTHGESPNPLRLLVRPGLRYDAVFTQNPVTMIASNPPGRQIIVDGQSHTAPRGFVWAPGSTHSIEVNATTQNSSSGAARFLFEGWSDGGEAGHSLQAAGENQTITANFKTLHLVTASSTGGARLELNPAPVADNFYEQGSTVQVVPASGGSAQFAQWGGDLRGTDTPAFLMIDEQKVVSATFLVPRQLNSGSVVNAANYLSTPIAPGEILTVFGLDLGPEALTGMQVTAGVVQTLLDNTRILFDGVPGPLIYVSPKQMSVMVPFSVAGKSQVRVSLEYRGQILTQGNIGVADAAPGIFTADASGRGQAAALNQDNSINSAERPAAPGSVVVLYTTGTGVLEPGVPDAQLATTLVGPRLPVRVRIGGRDAQVLYAGTAPGLIPGVTQINVRVPEDSPVGAVPVSFSVGEFNSPGTTTIAVR